MKIKCQFGQFYFTVLFFHQVLKLHLSECQNNNERNTFHFLMLLFCPFLLLLHKRRELLQTSEVQKHVYTYEQSVSGNIQGTLEHSTGGRRNTLASKIDWTQSHFSETANVSINRKTTFQHHLWTFSRKQNKPHENKRVIISYLHICVSVFRKRWFHAERPNFWFLLFHN